MVSVLWQNKQKKIRTFKVLLDILLQVCIVRIYFGCTESVFCVSQVIFAQINKQKLLIRNEESVYIM